MLFNAPQPDGREVEVLTKVDELKDNLQTYLREPGRWFGSLRRMSFARAIQGSNTIEGYSAALDDAAAVALGEEPLDADEETKLALAGYRDAMTFVLQLASDEEFVYSEQVLKSLHFMMTKHEIKNRPGQWRVGAVYVRNDQTGEIVYEGPEIDAVPKLVGQLILDLNEQTEFPRLIRAGMAHLNLVMIHPFRDSNGRIARCLQSLVLAREGLLIPQFMSIEEYLGHNTKEYYDVLGIVGGGSWQPERDTRPWIRFILKAHLRQATTMLRRVKEAERLWGDLEILVSKKGLPDRVVFVLYDAAMGFRVRNSTYRAVWDEQEVSEQTASRDLAQLVAAGLLVAHGARRGRFYLADEELRQVRRKIVDARGKRDDTDPFASAS